MNLYILSPLIYLLIGLAIGKSKYDFKQSASAILTKFVIPLVIIFNISMAKNGTFFIIFSMILIMFFMLFISKAKTKNPIDNLCFCYLNIGWLGLPIATSLFGNDSSSLIISAYVGSSIFGNSIGVGLLQPYKSFTKRFYQTIKTPPVIALLLGVLLIPYKSEIKIYGSQFYEVLKFLMSFLGMSVLGIWLSKTKVNFTEMIKSIPNFIFRASLLFFFLSLLIMFAFFNHMELITNNIYSIYLICLLPPAANIIILETHYLKEGYSAKKITYETCISIVVLLIYIFVFSFIKNTSF